MVRDTDLVSYLPPFMAEYGEMNTALTAENPEFTLVWDGKERVLKNQFIQTADEYGISVFERLLDILPSKSDPLEARRQRVLSRWFKRLPYTERMLLKKLIILLGEKGFTFQKDYGHYRITVTASAELYGQVRELERLLEEMTPANLIAELKNRISCGAKSRIGIYSGIRVTERFLITNDLRERVSTEGKAGASGAVTQVLHVKISG
ncbi:MAG: YmfQ family protein [[Eubacterium] siraeum]|nr:YmfQ family protein [[Eubacterium] siraeum]